jgi:hypothetical protein
VFHRANETASHISDTAVTPSGNRDSLGLWGLGGESMSPSKVEIVADVLHEAAETHHIVYKIVDGNDLDWASWYADWLINLSILPALLGRPPVRSELVWKLVDLDKAYTAQAPEEKWEHWYAERLLDHFSSET